MAERTDVPPEQQIGDAPIDPKYAEFMNALARGVDKLLNGDKDPKPNGFVLLVFPFDEVTGKGRSNYISNARREDIVLMLREQLRRFEGMASTTGHA